ncbi:hypothetical protein ABZX38_36255 [Streptomyces longwoodensis]|uniref:hypothetical protein n=1 Tax=Streptomyces longwoodensis TaxID=68231 RepID=UPI00339F822B
MLAAAREGLQKSTWRIGDPDEKLLLPIIGSLTVHLAKELGLMEDGWDAAQTRRKVADELRGAARGHPVGTARHQAFLDAARMAEEGTCAPGSSHSFAVTSEFGPGDMKGAGLGVPRQRGSPAQPGADPRRRLLLQSATTTGVQGAGCEQANVLADTVVGMLARGAAGRPAPFGSGEDGGGAAGRQWFARVCRPDA